MVRSLWFQHFLDLVFESFVVQTHLPSSYQVGFLTDGGGRGYEKSGRSYTSTAFESEGQDQVEKLQEFHQLRRSFYFLMDEICVKWWPLNQINLVSNWKVMLSLRTPMCGDHTMMVCLSLWQGITSNHLFEGDSECHPRIFFPCHLKKGPFKSPSIFHGDIRYSFRETIQGRSHLGCRWRRSGGGFRGRENAHFHGANLGPGRWGSWEVGFCCLPTVKGEKKWGQKIIPARDPKQCKNQMQCMCDHALYVSTLYVSALCVSTLCVSSMCEHSMCDHSMWALYMWPLYVSTICVSILCETTLCEHSMCAHSMREHSICDHSIWALYAWALYVWALNVWALYVWPLYVSTVCVTTPREHSMCEHSMCEHSMCDHSMCDHSMREHSICDHSMWALYAWALYVSTLCVSTLCVTTLCDHSMWALYVSTLCEHSMCDHSMCDHSMWALYVSTLCEHSMCEHSMCEHSMCDHSMWALYVRALYVSTLCEHSMCEHSMCDHSMWPLYVSTLCESTLCEHSMCEHSMCDHSMCEHSMCEQSICQHSMCDTTTKTPKTPRQFLGRMLQNTEKYENYHEKWTSKKLKSRKSTKIYRRNPF